MPISFPILLLAFVLYNFFLYFYIAPDPLSLKQDVHQRFQYIYIVLSLCQPKVFVTIIAFRKLFFVHIIVLRFYMYAYFIVFVCARILNGFILSFCSICLWNFCNISLVVQGYSYWWTNACLLLPLERFVSWRSPSRL